MPEATNLPLMPLLERVCADASVGRLLALRGEEGLVDVAAASGLRGPIAAALAGACAPGEGGVPLLVVTATGREADDVTAVLRSFLDYDAVADFPSWETLPHERMSPRSDTVGKRLAVLRRLAHPESGGTYGPIEVVVASVRALMQPLAKGLGDLEPVSLAAGDERPLEDIVEALVAAAYTRVDMVEKRGEFAVRGGILDVFPPTEDHPVRLEFWGDVVEEIRWFKVADQRSLEVNPHGLWAPPCRELLLTPEVRERAAELAPTLPGVTDMLSKVAEGIAVEGMESLMPALLPAGMETLVDVVRPGTHVVLLDPERVRTRAHDLVNTSQEFLDASWANAAAGNAIPVDLRSILDGGSYWALSDLRARLAERFTLTELSERTGGPARYVRIEETGQKIGFITPLTHNFCESCNRVRLTCTGELFMCLGQEDRADLRAPLRASGDDGPVREAIREAITRKPKGHDFDYSRRHVAGQVSRFMSHTGG